MTPKQHRTASLRFDSGPIAVSRGTRGSGGARRTLLFDCPELGADLVFFPDHHGAASVMYGQVFRQAEQAHVADARVTLGEGGRETRTDETGQFMLAHPHRTGLPGFLEIETDTVRMTCALPGDLR